MAAAAIEPTWTTALFRPINRLRDQRREQRENDSYELPQGLTEAELLPDLSPEHIIAAGITWEDFCLFLGRCKIIWMGPGLLYVCTTGHPGYRFVAKLGSMNHHLFVFAATELETAAATTAAAVTCDFLVHLLATSKEDRAYIHGTSVPISDPGLSRFFQESQDNLRKVTLQYMVLNEEHIQALATTEPRPNVEVILHECRVSDDYGCQAAFVECLQVDRGPTQLISCYIDCHVLATALEGNSRVTRLRLAPASARGDADMGAIFRSLADNKKGLVKLDLHDRFISDEHWKILCESLKGHPSLTSLDFRFTGPRGLHGDRIEISTEQTSRRARVLAAMVQEYRVLLTITLSEYERDEQIYMAMIHPYLEANLYRPRVLGIKKADIALRLIVKCR
jgi:hypothetical protein